MLSTDIPSPLLVFSNVAPDNRTNIYSLQQCGTTLTGEHYESDMMLSSRRVHFKRSSVLFDLNKGSVVTTVVTDTTENVMSDTMDTPSIN